MIDAAFMLEIERHVPGAIPEDVADGIWLAVLGVLPEPPAARESSPAVTNPVFSRPPVSAPVETPPPPAPIPKPEVKPPPNPTPVDSAATSEPGTRKPTDATLSVPGGPSSLQRTESPTALALRTPGGRALPGAREITRVLRPFRRRMPSRQLFHLDEERTAQQIAELKIWTPALQPAQARWLEMVLVIDLAPSMVLWRETLRELRLLLEQLGAFRDVRVWWLETSAAKEVSLRASPGGALRPARELIAPNGRRVVLVATDCLAPAWDGGGAAAALALWGASQPVALLQMLPQRLWRRTALQAGTPVFVGGREPGAPNLRLTRRSWRARRGAGAPAGTPVPVLTADPATLASWAALIHRPGGPQMPALIFPPVATALARDSMPGSTRNVSETSKPSEVDALGLVQQFQALASPIAFHLARLLAAAPLRLPVMRLIQHVLLPGSRQIHLAEVFLSGLLRRITTDPLVNPDLVDYEFLPGVRELLLDGSPVEQSVEVQQVVSEYLAARFGQSTGFAAVLQLGGTAAATDVGRENAIFARISAAVLRRLGGRYLEAAVRLEQLAETGVRPVSPSSAPATKAARPKPQGFKGARILIVDDHPQNNRNEVRVLKRLGAEVEEVTTTEQAVAKLRAENFDAIISDLRREKDEVAGLKLLEHLREEENFIPFALYAHASAKIARQALDQGAVICSSMFSEVRPALQAELERRQADENWKPPGPLPPDAEAKVWSYLESMRIPERFKREDNDARELLHKPSDFQWRLLWDELWRQRGHDAWDDVATLVEAATDSGYVQMWGVNRQRLQLLGGHIDPERRSYHEASWDGIIGMAARRGSSYWAPDALIDPHYIPADRSTRSELALAIRNPDNTGTVGVINIECPRPYAFGPRQIRWLNALAGSLAERMEKARMPLDVDWHRLIKLPENIAAFILVRAAYRLFAFWPPGVWEVLPTTPDPNHHALRRARTLAEMAEQWITQPNAGPSVQTELKSAVRSELAFFFATQYSEERTPNEQLRWCSFTLAGMAAALVMQEGSPELYEARIAQLPVALEQIVSGGLVQRSAMDDWFTAIRTDLEQAPPTSESPSSSPLSA